ncbi:MAG: serine/threonine protein kinase [Pseudomonadota bacterium]
MAMSAEIPFEGLEPEVLLRAVESVGYLCDGRLLALNSYENRVYQVGIEEAQPLVAKFYRPGRWSDAAILEEHAFSLELAEREIPVVAPLRNEEGESLHHHQGFRFALFPRRGGRWPDLDDPEKLRWLGRFLGRIHAVGAARRFAHRPSLDIQSFGEDSYQFLLERDFLPAYLSKVYRSVVEDLLRQVRAVFEAVGPCTALRLHGDCHPGNILWGEHGPHFVDLDDSRMGPAVQDLWMLLSGARHEQEQQLMAIVEGYQEFREFDALELGLIEALRALRLIHYAAWLARRWQDPAFPHNFPWFNTPRYWEEHCQALREQTALLEEPPLRLYL